VHAVPHRRGLGLDRKIPPILQAPGPRGTNQPAGWHNWAEECRQPKECDISNGAQPVTFLPVTFLPVTFLLGTDTP
jgi:hypothetical protein